VVHTDASGVRAAELVKVQYHGTEHLFLGPMATAVGNQSLLDDMVNATPKGLAASAYLKGRETLRQQMKALYTGTGECQFTLVSACLSLFCPELGSYNAFFLRLLWRHPHWDGRRGRPEGVCY
jgi:hypothetical protein